MEVNDIKRKASAIKKNVETVIIGKSEITDLILTAILSNGHILLEDVPGTGKTMLAKSLAKSFECEFSRIQFTPDLLPSDLTGINFYNPKSGEFVFRKGGLFTNILLGDEINRATPRTQSGLLECMEERQITVDGDTYALDAPYFVIATQNPVETQGTFPLPEAQLDRFIMQLSMGYPNTSDGISIIQRFIKSDPVKSLEPVCTKQDIIDMQESVKSVYVHDDVCRYITEIAEGTREHDAVALGVSPRGCIALARASQSFAALNGRSYATPDDVKYLAPYVFSHRLILRSGVGDRSARAAKILAEVTGAVKAPTEDFTGRG